MRNTIYLRRGADGKLERSSDRKVWTSTALDEQTIYGGSSEFRDLFQRFQDVQEVEELEQDLPLKTQRRIGRILHNALFDSQPVYDRWIHLVPILNAGSGPVIERENDAFLNLVCKLPWIFLTRSDSDNAEFLVRNANEPASVTIDAAPTRARSELFRDFKLPPCPTVLLVVPTDEIDEPTHGADHLNTLFRALEPNYTGVQARISLIHLRSLQDLQDAAKNGPKPHIVYFYGHAESQGGTTRFLFDPAPGEPDGWTDVDEIRAAIDTLLERWQLPPVVWVNACKGAAAERNNFLLALSPVASTVITTRTLAAIKESRLIAETALPMIVKDGRAPHSAVRDVLCRSAAPVLAGRWATTVISVQYDLWSALSTEDRKVEDLESAGDFPMRMDRTEPLRVIREHLALCFSNPPNRAHVVMWKGPPEQSLDVFAQRFIDLMEESFPDWTRLERRVELQLTTRAEHNRAQHLASLFLGLIGEGAIQSVQSINIARLRSVVHRLIAQRRTILLLIHGPFTEANLGGIHDYLEFWRDLPAELQLIGRDVHIVLAFAFLDDAAVDPPPLFPRNGLLIQQLGPVSPFELTDHLLSFRSFYNLKENEVPHQAQIDVEETKGYFRTIHARLEDRAKLFRWSLLRRESGEQNG